jgi:hypothetical protein
MQTPDRSVESSSLVIIFSPHVYESASTEVIRRLRLSFRSTHETIWHATLGATSSNLQRLGEASSNLKQLSAT